MEMNQDTLKGKWKEIKGDLQKFWGKITDDEWEQTKGDATAISGLVQQKYGQTKEEVSKRFNEITQKYGTEPARRNLEDSIERGDLRSEEPVLEKRNEFPKDLQ